MKEKILKSKTALVTGAGSGIGRATAVAFGREGVHVLLVGRREEPLRETLRLLEEAGGSGEVIAADLYQEEDFITKIVPAVHRHQKLHILVNNAAVADFGGCEAYTAAQIRDHYWLNAGVPLLLSQLLLEALKQAEGAHILNIGSDEGIRPKNYNSLYGSSKAALHFLTKSLAIEFAEANIRVNAIASGPVETQLLRAVVGDQEVITPLGRIFTPEEVAGWMVHVIKTDMTTGSVLQIDGGTTL